MVDHSTDPIPRPVIGIANSVGCAQLHALLASPTLDQLIDRHS